MYEIRPMNACTFDEALQAWNDGFFGVYRDLSFNFESWLARMVREDLRPDLSFITFDDAEPVGCILSGIRSIGGKVVAWNGGIGIAPAYRKLGLGWALMQKTLDAYERSRVDEARLETVATNQQAMYLYQNLGYTAVDKLFVFEQHESLDIQDMGTGSPTVSRMHKTSPSALPLLPFYNVRAPWQAQWHSAPDGEAVIAEDALGNPLGYALYKHHLTPEGDVEETALYQCEAHGDSEQARDIIARLLREAFNPLNDNRRRYTALIPESNRSLVEALRRWGFHETLAEWHLIKQMKQVDPA